MLPVAAVNEQKRWPLVARFEKVDMVALAGAVPQIEMIGISLTRFGRKPVPAGDDVGTSGYGQAVVETEVPLFLAHLAPVQRVERRRHPKISSRSQLRHVST